MWYHTINAYINITADYKNLTSLCGTGWAGRGTVVTTAAAAAGAVTAVWSGAITLTCVVAVAVAVTGTVTAGLYWVCYNM